ncbi:peptidase inhibitor family I36 protein [Streptomyces sp. NPDC001275]
MLAISAVGASSASADARANEFAAQAKEAGITAQEARELQARVDQEIKKMKAGGVQISANQIRSADGKVLITIPLPGEKYAWSAGEEKPLSAQASCSYGYLCLYDGTDYSGLMRSLYYCDFVNLGNYGQNDKLGSFINNQTSGTYARFYNWEEKWVLKFGSTAPQSKSLLGSPYNNYIDAVDPC